MTGASGAFETARGSLGGGGDDVAESSVWGPSLAVGGCSGSVLLPKIEARGFTAEAEVGTSFGVGRVYTVEDKLAATSDSGRGETNPQGRGPYFR